MLSAHSQAKKSLMWRWNFWALCLWIAERRMTQEALAVHECTSAFDTGLFLKYLPMYSVHQPEDEDNDKQAAPSQPPICFGWPMFSAKAIHSVVSQAQVCTFLGFSTALKSFVLQTSATSPQPLHCPERRDRGAKAVAVQKNSSRAPTALSRSC